jgi:glycosyltransferase A (GT-A) superfamily protein (DUF2064 family)
VTVALLVIAKAPAPGRSKTRLTPPFSPPDAAALAEAALSDTLDAVGAAHVSGRRVLVLDGAPGAWLPDGWEVVPQRGVGLDERLANAFADAGGPALLLGMDTPQVTPSLVADAVRSLLVPGVEAVLGPSLDGGYWAIGLRVPRRGALVGVPMSTRRTLAVQRRRLRALGIRVAKLPSMRDVDDVADALAVAEVAPWTRFAARVARLRGSLVALGELA